MIEGEARDEKGDKFRFKADAILGRVIQHEQDHLDSSEFTQNMFWTTASLRRLSFILKMRK